jgi:type II secretory pathway pseudopilin PulG
MSNYNNHMNLAFSASITRMRDRDSGYAMAALLVAMAVMAVLMTVALPTWKQTIRREKEEELIFRGTQYARALGAYQRKYANASPQSIDVLVDQHFLRKKYKDPLAPTEDGDFAFLYVNNQGTSGQAGQVGNSYTTTPTGGGIVGVVSKNTGESLRVYNDKTHYNEWQFVALQQSTQGGGAGGPGPGSGAGAGRQGAPGGATPGGSGGRGGQQGPGGRSPQSGAGGPLPPGQGGRGR